MVSVDIEEITMEMYILSSRTDLVVYSIIIIV